MSAACIQVHFRLDSQLLFLAVFFYVLHVSMIGWHVIVFNNMNPDQTAPKEQSGVVSYCLQYSLPKNISK